jgi:dTDP-N-acetylfucosamine:lipid II N-acetylfucosaminyltransferase
LNYHILIQDKFIDGFIEDVYKLNLAHHNKFLIRGKSGDSSYLNSKREINFIGNSDQEINFHLSKLEPDDVVWIHWYDEQIAKLVYRLPNKICVFFWGGEIYEKPFWHNFSWLFDKITKRLILGDKNLYNPSLNDLFNLAKVSFYKLKEKSKYRERQKQIIRIDYLVCSSYNTVEIDLLKKLYPTSRFKHLPGSYSVNYNEILKINPKKKTKRINILVGNSATPTNNHLDIFKSLIAIEADIYCILSYGDIQYKEKIIEIGQQFFKERFHPIVNFMDRKQYLTFLNDMDIIVMNHNRSQAWGNLASSIILGKPIFIKSNNPISGMLNNLGVGHYDISELQDLNLEEIISIELKNRSSNIKKLNFQISDNQRLQELALTLNSFI